MTTLAPIAFFCFNRADKTKQVLEALAANDLSGESEIFIFCDGPRNIRDLPAIKEVYAVIDSLVGFKKIHITKREINYGSQFSIIYGINSVLDNHDSVIVVEDDILTSKHFLKFTNEALNFYRDEKDVWCITGFNYPKNLVTIPNSYREDVFFVRGKNSSWGWGSWKDRWQKIDFEIKDYEEFSKNKKLIKAFNRAGGNMFDMLRMQKQNRINAWDIQMSYAMFKAGGYTVHSSKPLTKNIGFDASGTHTNSDLDLANFEFEDSSSFKFKKLSDIPNNNIAQEAYLAFHRDPFFLIKWARSKKKRNNFKWLSAGILLALISRMIFAVIFR
ncbi:MAG: hypothetical protein FJX34_00710 [Alphaproteobacteria bacterium]|nr:hypothetical protein [Alphaproteobacteria bacterium]